MNQKQVNYTIAETFKLPSRGIIYDCAVNPQVKLRSMTARDQMKRLAPSNSPFKLLSQIIDDCLIEKPGISVYDMALADYEYLLHRLRVVTYGDDYAIQVTCPTCDSNISTSVHLDQLQIVQIDQQAWQDLHTIKLPRSGDTIKLNFTTPRMLQQAEALAKQLKRKLKNVAINFESLAGLLLAIDSVNGKKLVQFQLQNYIDRLPALDLQKILNARQKLNSAFGISNSIDISCDQCGNDIHTFFRFGAEFFRPSTI